MMRVAVGCPIRDRAWIFPEWVEHVRAAFRVAGLTPVWVFVVGTGPGGDDGTQAAVSSLFRDEPGIWGEIAEEALPPGRHWSPERYDQMADLRNRLLQLVRALAPDYFLSLDSDILLHPSALLTLLDSIQGEQRVNGALGGHFDAVGGKTYLSSTSRNITTWANLTTHGGLRREDSDGVFQCEVLMAIKLMSPAAYCVDYNSNRFGEDIGWSLNCRDAGLVLGWDGRIASKHVMEREQLHAIDPRLGW